MKCKHDNDIALNKHAAILANKQITPAVRLKRTFDLLDLPAMRKEIAMKIEVEKDLGINGVVTDCDKAIMMLVESARPDLFKEDEPEDEESFDEFIKGIIDELPARLRPHLQQIHDEMLEENPDMRGATRERGKHIDVEARRVLMKNLKNLAELIEGSE